MASPASDSELMERIETQLDSLDASTDSLQEELGRCVEAAATDEASEVLAALGALQATCIEMQSTLTAVEGDLEAAAEQTGEDQAAWLEAAAGRRKAMVGIVEGIEARVEDCINELT